MKNLTVTGNTQISLKAFLKSRLTILLVIAASLTLRPSQSQVNVSNIVSQPLWGPVDYDYVEYYYLPEADVYYYVPTSQFIYLNAGNWVFVSVWPTSIHRIDLYKTYKVVVNEPMPYMNHTVNVNKYGKYKTYRSKQVIIRDSLDSKYYAVEGHQGQRWIKRN